MPGGYSRKGVRCPPPAGYPAAMRSGRGLRYVVVMVGLPARGKTFTARKLARYLSWLGYPTRVWNVGEERRRRLGPHQPADFFDPANRAARAELDAIAADVLEELLGWLQGGGRIAILDATNSTAERRRFVRERAEAQGFECFFIQVVNDDPAVVEENIRRTKLDSPDYAGIPADAAVRDFRARLAHYEGRYQPLRDEEGPCIHLVDRGRRVVLHEIDGYVPARIVFFLTNLRLSERVVWLTRHGESEFNVAGRIGGDSALSEKGRAFSRRLAALVDERFGRESGLQIWTSTLRRTVATAAPLGREVGQWRSLDEIDAGVCDGWTYTEISTRLPEEYAARQRDKLQYRYPRGESYQDVIQRVDRVILELERHRVPVLVIAHQAVLRVLYAYFLDLPPERLPFVDVPLHQVIELSPRPYGCSEQRISLGP